MVGTAQVRRGGLHPPVGKRTLARNEDFFDEQQLRELRDYIAPLRRNKRIRTVLSTAVELGLVFGLDVGPRVAGWVDGQGWLLRLLAVAFVLDLAGTVVSAPFSAWANLVYEKRAGHSTMTVATFVKDLALNSALNLVLTVVLFGPIYFAIHTFGGAWWLVGGALVVVALGVVQFVAPIWIMPRFNKFTPLPEGPIRDRIEELARLSDVKIEGVYLMDASKRTNRANAGVTGFGKTKRVIVNDTICEFPMDELSQVIAHELGHYRLNHTLRSFPVNAVQMPLGLLFVHLVASNETLLRWAGVDGGLGDPASYGLVGLVFGLALSVSGVGGRWLSRLDEREADLEALQLLGDPTSFVAVWPRMVLNDKANLEPTPWEKLQSTHPEIAERMQFGLDWAALNDAPVTRPAKRSVPEATAAS